MDRKLLLQQLARKLAPGELAFDEERLVAFSGDKWFAAHRPEAAALPQSTAAVATILEFAHEHRIPVTPRGAGYGYVGGCVPVQGGIALSVSGMNRILDISKTDFVAVVQPGVITAQLQSAVEKKGLYYPPDPASRADCSIGGNVATNAGGPRCLKYGVTRDYVLGLEVVLADGTVTRLGARTHKNKTGFDLHRLFVGSEGMLGVVTEATLKLIPLPPYRACYAVGFTGMATGVRALEAIFEAGFLPSALELADGFTLAAAHKRTGAKWLAKCQALLIVELDGQEGSVKQELRALAKVLKGLSPIFVQKGLGPDGCEKFWKLRREFSYALRDTGLKKLNEDVVVPRGKLKQLFDLGAKIQKKHGIAVACFGHAGDGNIHVNLMLDDKDPSQVQRGEEGLDALFQGIIALGGSITGEHGIGLAKKRWWPIAVSAEAQQLHRTIKNTLDPRGILNPGKFLD
ncbi:MAG TPA: FAD-linked oxidase C-terminal domain-containing protein [Candidatus Limnocylindria bacterium]|jgi:glycolate oxidase subunit GlcD|nr:FAD-linked oxidase C-terminal domain-containing protein [Candidatus Limnocylindria bacterium]